MPFGTNGNAPKNAAVFKGKYGWNRQDYLLDQTCGREPPPTHRRNDNQGTTEENTRAKKRDEDYLTSLFAGLLS
ncbi:MAG: hypothetical protein ACJA1I_001639 [Zhongshania marina]|jgi:hypothetical protein